MLQPPSRREHTRFRISAPVVITIPEAGGQELRGITRDLSAFGVFVIATAALQVGDEVSVEVQFPRLEQFVFAGVQLKASGKVVRLAGPKEAPGFAVQAQFALPDEL